MLEFELFDINKDSHKQYALDGQDVIFEDSEGILRFGWIYEEYLGNGYSKYLLRCGDIYVSASNYYFCPITKKDK